MIAVASIIGLFTFINALYFLVGISKTLPGTVFTGAVYYTPDYYFYLSQIIQGKTRWFTNFPLFSGDITVPQLIGWFYTLSGHILLPLGLSPKAIFILLTITMSVLFLTVSYLLIKTVLPKARHVHLWSFLLFLTANTMPTGSYSFTQGWYNFGNPLERLTYIPHHLLMEAAAMASLIVAIRWWTGKLGLWKTTILCILLGFILSSMQPALWMVLTIALSIGGLWKPKSWVTGMLPAVIVGASGAPVVAYLKYYLYTLPYYHNQLIVEPSWSRAYSFRDYILLHGPLVITALLGLPLWLKSFTREKSLLTAAAVVSLGLFYSPAGVYLQILNIRFLSVIPTLFYALVTASALAKLKVIGTVIMAALVIMTVPLLVQELEDRNYLFFPTNNIIYPPKEVYLADQKAAELSTPDDVFLVYPPWDTMFPGVSGRRVLAYWAAPYWTIDFEEKRAKAEAFAAGKMTEDEKRAFLKEYNISYVLNYSDAPPLYNALIPVYKNNFMTIFKVPKNE